MTTPDARANDAAMLALIKTIQEDLNEIRSTLQIHIKTEPAEWAKVLSELMNKSFPEGDPVGHREAHEAQMKAIKDRAEFWHSLLKEITKWGIMGVLGWLAYHAWVAFLQGPR